MAVIFAIGLAVVTLLIVLLVQWKRKYRNMPPGPQPLPIIGNFHQIDDSKMAVDLTKIGMKYGEIFTVHFLMTPVIVMNSYDVIKKLLASPEYTEIFSGRVSGVFSKHLLPDDMIFQSVTDGQQYMRRLVMRGVKQYGTGLKRVETIAHEELKKMIVTVKKRNGVAFDPMSDIVQFLSNIIMVLVCGERFDPDHRIMQMAHEIAFDFEYLFNYKREVLMDVIPFATQFPSNLRKACLRMIENNNFFTNTLTQMRKEGTSNHPDCLFALLEEEYQDGKITLNNVKGIALDMIIAGIFTTSPTIYSALVVLTHYPEVQRKIQEEIQRVVGTDRLPGLDDKPNLPYCHATMLEMFRYLAPSPIAGPRMTIRECTFRGYDIPKNTMAVYNVWHVHHDEEFWEEPFKFDPTRFLDSDGDLVPPEHERRKRLLTFGLGKRSCVGEILARVRIFLAMTSILQHFDLKKDPTLPFPSADPRTYHVKFITAPPAYKVRFVPRY